ncbi:MAG TPA: bacteriohopanetetrol glucosamine biosynthesis glycosyltransferase HpnI [Vicinamibacterales bacterium]|nr:bacteriohopanetetrol glucosamine biosynthesis glycosyltransferase HpnI [Vicinamibacterales bacterium]
MLAEAVRWVVLAGAVLPLAYDLVAIAAVRRFSRRRPPGGAATPPVSLLKPVRGLDRDSYGNFASFCRQDYPEYEILFAVADDDDPAVPVIQRVIAEFPGRPIRLLVGAPQLGESSKVNKLCRLAQEARHDLLVINDSDIRVGPDYLRAVVGPFEDPQVGLVTCLYTGLRDGSLGAALESLAIATDFAAAVLVAWWIEGVRFALGATMAVPRARLAEIGGFEALVDYCAEDFELGARIAAGGHRVELAPYVVQSECVTTTGAFVRHALRWAITRRHCRPGGHAGLVVTQGLPWAVAAAAVAPSVAVAVAYPAAYLALRLAMAREVGVRGLGDRGLLDRWWLVPVYDAIACVIWGVSLFRNRIEWRGRVFHLRRGRLVPVAGRRDGE